jgi:hypothetical protein
MVLLSRVLLFFVALIKLASFIHPASLSLSLSLCLHYEPARGQLKNWNVIRHEEDLALKFGLILKRNQVYN